MSFFSRVWSCVKLQVQSLWSFNIQLHQCSGQHRIQLSLPGPPWACYWTILLWSPSCFTPRSPTFLPALSIASGCCWALPIVLASSWINRTRLNMMRGRWCPWGTPGRAIKVGSGHGAPWSGPTKQFTCSLSGLKVMHWFGNLTTTLGLFSRSSFSQCLLIMTCIKWSYLTRCKTRLSAVCGLLEVCPNRI